MTENLKTGLRTIHGGELGETEIQVLEGVYRLKKVTEIAEKIGEPESTVYRYINGLSGRTENIPKKYHYENRYLERLPNSTDLPIKFRLTSTGLRVIADYDIPTSSENVEEKVVTDSGESAEGDWEIRPHYITAKFLIRDSPDGWGRDAQFLDEEVEWEERVIKELPDGSVTEGRAIFYEGHRIELYERSVVVRWDFPGQVESPKVFWRRHREKMGDVVAFLESRFGIKLRSRPENREASISTQHWAHLDDIFAQMVVGNKEKWGDSEEGVLWMVRNERDEPVALVDTSPSDIDGEDGDVELEWVHPQEGKNHMDNVKDLLRWGSYYEITPKDFRDLKWLRENVDMFDSILDRLEELDGVKERLEELGDRVTENRQGLEEVASVVVDGFQEQREKIEGNRNQVRYLGRAVGGLQESVRSQGSSLEVQEVMMEQHEERLENHMEFMKEIHRKTLSYQLARILESFKDSVSSAVGKVREVFSWK